jgi:hypothetical protein
MIEYGVDRPHPVTGDVDQPNARLLEPVGDALVSSMPAAGSGSGGFGTVSAVASTARATACGTSRGVASPDPASRSVADDMYLQSRSTFRAATISAQAARLRMRWNRAAVRAVAQPSTDDGSLLELLLADQSVQPGLHAEYGRPRVDRLASRTPSTISW